MRLRAHHLLCLQGFRGKGYDARFTRTMKEIMNIIKLNPNLKVRVIDQCDIVCSICPWISDNRCMKEGVDREEEIREGDMEILRFLELPINTEMELKELFLLTRKKVPKLPSICKRCEWLDRGVCKVWKFLR
ncbi:MAG: DUF1284 domain-containing protein [Candidatus Hydrothermarchaeota archaeon]